MQGKFCLVKSASLLQLKRLFLRSFQVKKLGAKKQKIFAFHSGARQYYNFPEIQIHRFLLFWRFWQFKPKIGKFF